MPLYEFRCDRCDQRFEELCENTEASNGVRCPGCRSRRVSRLLSTFAVSVQGGRKGGSASACSTCTATSCTTCTVR